MILFILGVLVSRPRRPHWLHAAGNVVTVGSFSFFEFVQRLLQVTSIRQHQESKRATMKQLVTTLRKEGIRWRSEEIAESGARAVMAIAPYASSEAVRAAFGALIELAPVFDAQAKLLRLGSAVTKACPSDFVDGMAYVLEALRTAAM